jgi:hypothetical protein
MGGVYEVVVGPSDEVDYRTRAVSDGTLRLKKKRPYREEDITLRVVDGRLEYEVGYSGLRRQNIQLVGIFAGLFTLASAILAIWDRSAALYLGLLLGGFLVFMALMARISADVGEPLVTAVAEEMRSAELEERIRSEVRRELRSKYRVMNEEDPPDTEEGEREPTERRRQTR